jgi:hypothetical protein
MNKKLYVALALAAGLLGGVLTRYIAPPAAFAQNQAPATKEIRAQSFTLVDSSNRTAGTFTVVDSRWSELPPPPPGAVPPAPAPRGRGPSGMRIVLRDSNGREIWSAGDTAQIRPVSER